MSTHVPRSSRALAIPVIVVGVALLGAAPAPAQDHEHAGAAAPDTAVTARLEATTAHFRQMLRTLEQNPSLEQQWAGQPVLAATVATGRSSSRAARRVSRLSSTLDSLAASDAAEENEELARRLRRIDASTERMMASLRSIAGELEGLRAVAHRETEGGAHQLAGADTVAHQHAAGADAGHHRGLHFAHPLTTESVSPDTKLRVDYDYRDLSAGEHENAATLAAEWSPHRSFSIEASVPYSLTADATGFSHVALKFANYAFEGSGVSLGYGVGLGLPTSGDAPGHTHQEEGHTHAHRVDAAVLSDPPRPRFNGTGGVHSSLGKDLWTFEPFLNAGWKTGRWELVGFGTFDIPTNHAEQAEVGTELGYNASALFRAAPEVQATLELHGTAGLSGHATGEAVANVTPGVKLRPSGDSPFFLGLAGSFPVTTDERYGARALVSLFYHFR